MAIESQPPVHLCFGPFEVNAPAGELVKGGVRIRLPSQPFQILLLLLASPGEVVTREVLREQIWGQGTFVDFEHGLNAAINKLRRALGDSADNPRYIETIAGRGYRFIGPLERFPDTAVAALRTDSGTPAASTGTPLPERRTFLRPWIWIALAALSAVFGIWGMVTVFRTKAGSVARPVLEFAIPPPSGTIFAPPITRQPFAISPDGTRLAFTATGANGTNIWMRDLASLEMQPVPGTENAWGVFWSPDSRSLFYSVKEVLKQADLATGSTHAVAHLPYHALFGSWRAKGDLMLDLGPPDFYELTTENGSLRKLSDADMRWAQFLPDTDHFVHVIFDPALARYRAIATDYISRRSMPLMQTDSRVQYAPPFRVDEPGALLYIRGSSLLVQPFDAEHLRLAGEPFPIAQNVIYFRPTASACFSVSDNGVLVYQAPFPVSELNWYDRAGHVLSAVGRPASYAGPVRISPDGRQVAAALWTADSGGMDIWIFDANGRETRRLTYPPESHIRPVWSPDGKRVAFAASRTSGPALASLDAEGNGKMQMLPAGNRPQLLSDPQLPTDWSRDGRFITFDTGLGEEEQQVLLADTTRGGIVSLLHGEFAQWGAVFSPDGKRLAFISAESGRPEVYVQAFDSLPSPKLVGEKRQISANGGWIVRWRGDGRELFYVDNGNWLRAVSIEGPLQFGEPKPLFRIAGTSQYGTTSDFQFDVTRDGQRFVMSTTGSTPPPPFTVIENWPEKFHH